ncbi:FAD-dependent oxidoreductase [Salinibacterium sp. ZJ454]|uniref:FAD-dependent oxidoreductase n=1 Tax=Salinibacterium sp. ZJ454 TaxID=2708339 RepID=UPI001AB02E2B|nr:FAD-dependent oxidoreductase [Salinibacterium sp. ZJ454]
MDESQKDRSPVDLLVIGGGGAGMCAALAAQERGLRVTILEADTKLGGATALCSGVFYAAGTSIQEANGVIDSPEQMYEYIMTLNQGALRPDIIHTLSSKARDGLQYLLDLGASFPTDNLVGGGRTRVPRGHSCDGVGGTIADALIREVQRHDIDIRLGVRVESLVVEDGAVVGARDTSGLEYRARAVAITTGGLGNSMPMLKRFFPSVAQHGDRVWAVHEGAPFILGEGIEMAEAIGAHVIGHDTGLPMPTAGFAHNVEGVLPPWIMLVNSSGRRFMSETSAFSVSGYLINAQEGSRAFAIFDEKALQEVSDNLDYLDPLKQNMSVPSWHKNSIQEQVAKGVVKKADTLAELAEQAEINLAGLEATVAKYNADYDTGSDSVYMKSAGHHPVRVSPFYAVEVRSSMIGLTGAGLEIDPQARVLDPDGRVVPGLYAAGETTGGVVGSRYAAGGIMIAGAVVFGRILGQTVADELEGVTAAPGREMAGVK